MSSCKLSKELINQKLDNALNDIQQAELEEHLNLCSDCNSYYQNMIELHQRLLNLPIIDQQESIVDQIIIDIDQIKYNKHWFKRYGLATAAAILLFFPIAFLTNQNNSEDLVQNQEFFAADTTDGQNVSINNTEIRATQNNTDSNLKTSEPSINIENNPEMDRNYSGQNIGAFEAYRIEAVNNQLVIYNNEEVIYETKPWEGNLTVDFYQLNQNEVFYSLSSADSQIIASYIINLESKEEKIVE